MLIFPEGGRSPDGWGQPFRGGAAYLSSRCDVPVVPLHIEGTAKILRKGAKRPSPADVRVTFGTPLLPEDGESAIRFAERIERAVAELADEATTDWWQARQRAARGDHAGAHRARRAGLAAGVGARRPLAASAAARPAPGPSSEPTGGAGRRGRLRRGRRVACSSPVGASSIATVASASWRSADAPTAPGRPEPRPAADRQCTARRPGDRRRPSAPRRPRRRGGPGRRADHAGPAPRRPGDGVLGERPGRVRRIEAGGSRTRWCSTSRDDTVAGGRRRAPRPRLRPRRRRGCTSYRADDASDDVLTAYPRRRRGSTGRRRRPGAPRTSTTRVDAAPRRRARRSAPTGSSTSGSATAAASATRTRTPRTRESCSGKVLRIDPTPATTSPTGSRRQPLRRTTTTSRRRSGCSGCATRSASASTRRRGDLWLGRRRAVVLGGARPAAHGAAAPAAPTSAGTTSRAPHAFEGGAVPGRRLDPVQASTRTATGGAGSWPATCARAGDRAGPRRPPPATPTTARATVAGPRTSTRGCGGARDRRAPRAPIGDRPPSPSWLGPRRARLDPRRSPRRPRAATCSVADGRRASRRGGARWARCSARPAAGRRRTRCGGPGRRARTAAPAARRESEVMRSQRSTGDPAGTSRSAASASVDQRRADRLHRPAQGLRRAARRRAPAPRPLGTGARRDPRGTTPSPGEGLAVGQVEAAHLEHRRARRAPAGPWRRRDEPEVEDAPLRPHPGRRQLGLDRAEPPERLAQRIDGREPAEALPGVDEALVPQQLQRLADRDPARLVGCRTARTSLGRGAPRRTRPPPTRRRRSSAIAR